MKDLEKVSERIVKLSAKDKKIPDIEYSLLLELLKRARRFSFLPVRHVLKKVLDCQELINSTPIDFVFENTSGKRLIESDLNSLQKAKEAYIKNKFGNTIYHIASNHKFLAKKGISMKSLEETLFMKTLYNYLLPHCKSKAQCYRLIAEIIKHEDESAVKKRINTTSYSDLFQSISNLLPEISATKGIRK